MAQLTRCLPYRLRRLMVCASAVSLLPGMDGLAAANPFGVSPVSEQALSDMRGGFELPNGMIVSVGVQIDTYVDRSLALRTVLNVADKTNSGLEITLPSASDLGAISIVQTSDGSAVILKGADLEIQHLTGSSTGVVIANTLDNRVIDTVATVNVSLSDSAVPVGNILLRIESVVLDAVGARM